MDILEKLSLAGLVPVIRIEDARDAVALCGALSEGGLPVAEITFRTDAAQESIRRVHEALPGVMLGAGTVLTVEQADRAMDAGASYIVSPGFNPKVVAHCVERGIAVLPGCANPSDIEAALEFGLSTVKFFPAEALGGLKLIKAMSAPYGNVRFVPTGGIDEKNAVEYLAHPKVAAVGGSWMVPGDAVKQKDWARIRALAAGAVETVLGLEVKHVGINSGSKERAQEDACAFAHLLGAPIREASSSVFAGTAFEMMMEGGRGEKGHVALATHSIARARWHMQRRGYTFDEDSAKFKDGKMTAIYLKGDFAGFAVHLLQK